jgi:methionine synthase II (cobalamin-independent)
MVSHDFHDSDIEAISSIPPGMDFGVGVINGKNLNVESPEWIADGIRKVLRVIPPERVCTPTARSPGSSTSWPSGRSSPW